MNASCCGLDSKSMSEKFNVKVDETEKGIKILIEPKDQSKVESFKKFVESTREWCDCGPNCC